MRSLMPGVMPGFRGENAKQPSIPNHFEFTVQS